MAWYDRSWDYRVQITIDKTQVSGDLTDFPVYVDLSDLPAGFFSNVQADGDDIRVTRSDGTTECAFELVSIDTGGSTGELHFKANFISSTSDTSFYIYYGNAGASAYAVTATYGRNNVWTNGFVYVNHMESTTGEDSTGNAGSASVSGAPTTTTGKLSGNSITFNGSNEYLSHSDFSELSGMGNLGLSCWFKSDSFASNIGLAGQVGTGYSDRNFWVDITTQRGLSYYVAGGSGNGVDDTMASEGSSTALSTGVWTHIMGDLDCSADDGSCYKNGVTFDISSVSIDNNGSDSVTRNSAAPFYIGQRGNSSEYWDGEIDEIRLYDARRDSNWNTAEYNNQNDTSTFYSVSDITSIRTTKPMQPIWFF